MCVNCNARRTAHLPAPQVDEYSGQSLILLGGQGGDASRAQTGHAVGRHDGEIALETNSCAAEDWLSVSEI